MQCDAGGSSNQSRKMNYSFLSNLNSQTKTTEILKNTSLVILMILGKAFLNPKPKAKEKLTFDSKV